MHSPRPVTDVAVKRIVTQLHHLPRVRVHQARGGQSRKRDDGRPHGRWWHGGSARRCWQSLPRSITKQPKRQFAQGVVDRSRAFRSLAGRVHRNRLEGRDAGARGCA